MRLSIIIPVYNSANTIQILIERLYNALSNHAFEVVMVNDGSRDDSDLIGRQLSTQYPSLRFISLRRNFGEFNAVMCGLNHATGDYCVMIDDDFQNPPSEILKLAETAQKGNFDVVYSFYADKQHSFVRNVGSWIVNRLTTWLLDKPNHLYLSSFKLISRPVVNEIIKYKGPYPYIDGLIFRITRNVGKVEVMHAKRQDGQSGYTIRKLVSLFFTILFGYSLKPLRLMTGLGLMISTVSLLLLLIKLVFYSVQHPFKAVTFTLMAVLMVGGLILTSLGIVGEYIGRIAMTQSGLPQYIIKSETPKNATTF
jgi:glycosyltransferase involved in cell wall biosynthesis